MAPKAEKKRANPASRKWSPKKPTSKKKPYDGVIIPGKAGNRE